MKLCSDHLRKSFAPGREKDYTWRGRVRETPGEGTDNKWSTTETLTPGWLSNPLEKDKNPFKPSILPGSGRNCNTPRGFIEEGRKDKNSHLPSDKEKCPGFKWTSAEKSSLKANLLRMWWGKLQAKNCALESLQSFLTPTLQGKTESLPTLLKKYSTELLSKIIWSWSLYSLCCPFHGSAF